MGNFGKGRSMGFFMTTKDQKEFLNRIEGDTIFFIMDYLSKNKHIKLFKKITESEWTTFKKSNNWLIYNRGIGKLEIRYNNNFKKYLLLTGKSPIIQFWPSVKIGKIIEQGRISAFLSFIEDIPNNETVEIYQPLNFVGWWNQVAKTLKKMCVRYHAFDPILKKKLRLYSWVGPEAAKLYNRGIKFQDNFNETALQITFHPEKSYKEKQNKN